MNKIRLILVVIQCLLLILQAISYEKGHDTLGHILLVLIYMIMFCVLALA